MATIEIDQRKINQWSRGSEKGLEKREEEGGGGLENDKLKIPMTYVSRRHSVASIDYEIVELDRRQARC